MTRRRMYLAPLLFFMVGVMAAPMAYGQRLYDKDQDAKAQTAKEQAAKIKSGSLFDSQLKNINTLSQLHIETYFINAKRSARANMGKFSTWGKLDSFIQTIKEPAEGGFDDIRDCPGEEQLPSDFEAAVADVKQARKALENEIKAAADAAKKLQDQANHTEDKTLKTILAHIGDLKPVLDVADKVFGSDSSANTEANTDSGDDAQGTAATSGKNQLQTAKELIDIAKDLGSLYNAYNDKIEAIRKEVGKLEHLSVILQKMALQGLQAREEHLKILAAIYLRRATEEGSIQYLSDRYASLTSRLWKEVTSPRDPQKKTIAYYRLIDPQAATMTSDDLKAYVSKQSIDETIQKLILYHQRTGRAGPQPTMLQDTLLALHYAAALAARGDTPKQLATLRAGLECHRYSVRKSAIRARTYELAVSSGVDRLALFYSGGIKPSQVAQLFHNLATPLAIIFK